MDGDMNLMYHPTPAVFAASQSASIKKLITLTSKELRSILASLVRTSLCPPLDTSENFALFQNEIQRKITDMEAVNSIMSLLSVDFNVIHQDAVKKQQLLKKKLSIGNTEVVEKSSKGLLLEFEESAPLERTRLVVSELLRIMAMFPGHQNKFYIDDTELFESSVYLEEIADIICIVFAELPFLLTAPELSEALLHVRFGTAIICRLVANNPDCFDIVCSSILGHTQSSDEFEIETQIRTKALQCLCSMNPLYCKILRAECVSLCQLAGLSITLSVTINQEDHKSDLVPFFTGILLASDSKTKGWIAEYIKSAQKDSRDSALSMFKTQLVTEMHNVIKDFQHHSERRHSGMDTDCTDLPFNDSAMHGIAIMRLYCALKTTTGFKLSHEESEALLNLITCQPIVSSVGVRYIIVSVCTLLACSFLLQSREREENVMEWLNLLIKQTPQFQGLEAERNISYGETLLLIAIHFHGHTLEPIVDLVCSMLGIKLKLGSLTKIKILFTQQIFPENVVAEHALTVPVTRNLNGTIKGFLPVHCIQQLMKSRVFTKNSISVKDWLFKQLCSCTTPVHSLMLPLIETYVHSVIMPLNISRTKHQRMSTLEAFGEDMILEIFTKDTSKCCDTQTTQVLMMLYALLYQNTLLANMKSLVNNSHKPREYSPLLYSSIPMKQLLLKVKANEKDYGDLYPTFLRILSTHYPHLCLVEDWIEEEELTENYNNDKMAANHNKFIENDEDLLQIEKSPQAVLKKLTKIIQLPAHQIIPYMDLTVKMLPKLLDGSVPRKIQTLVVKVWLKLNTVVPRKLWLATVNILRKQPAQVQLEWEKTPEYTDEEIQADPLIVLRCDLRVYRCPPVFDVVTRVVSGYLMAARALLTHHLLANPIGQGSRSMQEITAAESEREELKSALISAQESAAIQILLEACLLTDLEKQTDTYSVGATLREIQCKICCFIHQSFILRPNMAKLIHFQGYPPELLSVTVPGVPSMHICIDFIPELMNQPQLEKQLFAAQLVSHLSVQYPIPKSYSMCKYMLQRMNDLLVALPVAKRNQYFVPATTCLKRICLAFPPLREDVTEFLLKLGKIAVSQLTKSSVTGISSVNVSNKDDGGNDEPAADEMEVDEYHDESNQPKPIEFGTNLDGDNPAFSRPTYLTTRNSKDLFDATEEAFRAITNFSLNDKLVIIDDVESTPR